MGIDLTVPLYTALVVYIVLLSATTVIGLLVVRGAYRFLRKVFGVRQAPPAPEPLLTDARESSAPAGA